MPEARLPPLLARLDALTDWERRPRNRMNVSLAPMRDLAARVGHPERAFRVIHITGTKGKGSVSALIEACMIKAGLFVGRYSSPHITHVSERISLSGNPIEESLFADCLVQALHELEICRAEESDGAAASWFDIMTLAAFLAFRAAGLDWAVVEVGLGGRLDSTNIVEPEVAVITNVELEHMEVLGTSRSAIAREKGGIVKSGAALVTPLDADDEAGAVLHGIAAERCAAMLQANAHDGMSIAERNAEIAASVLGYLGEQGLTARSGMDASRRFGAWLIDSETIASARLPGRMERGWFASPVRPSRPVPVVLDGAHVPFNLGLVLADLSRDVSLKGPPVAVVGLGGDKDAEGCLRLLAERDARVVTTCNPSLGSHSAAELRASGVSIGLACEMRPGPATALEFAAAIAAERDGWVLVTGSLHLVGALRSLCGLC